MNELRIDRTYAWLEPHNIKKIADTYWKFKNVEAFANVLNKEDVLLNNGNLSLQLYVKKKINDNEHSLADLISDINEEQEQLNSSINSLYKKLKEIGIAE